MASGGAVSQTKGSEYIFEFCCTPCSNRKNGGRIREAVNQCVDCNEYLCRKCTKFHNRLGATADHNVIGQKDMKKAQGSNPKKPSLCQAHGGERITLYCGRHDVVCCHAGIAVDHKECGDIRYIKDAAAGIKSSEQIHSAKSTINYNVKEAKRMKMSRESDLANLDKEKSSSIQQVQDYTGRQIHRLRELEKATIEQIRDRHTTLSKCVGTDVDSLDEVILTMEEDLQKLDISQDMQDSHVFIHIKQSQSHETECRKLLKQRNKPSMKILLKSSVDRALHDLSSLASFADENREYNATLKGDTNVKVKQDTDTCNISGSCQLPDGTAIIADGNNKRIKRLDASYRVTDHCDMIGQPFGVACTVPDEVAVTIPSLKKVQFVSVRKSLSLTRTVSTNECCRGISYIGGKLYVSCVNVNKKKTAHVEVFDLQGTLLTIIQNDSCGRQIFSRPSHICASLNDRNVYIGDWDCGVKMLDNKGTLAGTISAPSLKDVRGLCPLDNGHILVCGYTSNNVIQFDGDGRQMTELLRDTSGLKRPQSMCYNENNSVLIITMKDTDTIKVFDLV